MEREVEFLQSTSRASGTETTPDLNGFAGWVLGVLRGLRTERQQSVKQLKLLETLSLGGKRQLMLVSCAGEHFLVGGGSESVETIVRVQGEVSPDLAAKELGKTCL
jgi:flagellar biogenesis protein FliO